MNPATGISPKVSNAGMASSTAGAATVIIVWVLGHWVTIPPEIASAISTLVVPVAGFIGGYLTPHDPTTQAALNAQQPQPQQPGAAP
jgi:hypothetical protein